MRAILVHASHESAESAGVETGIALARRLGGHLTAHVNTPVTRLYAMDGFGGVYPLDDAIAELRTRAQMLATALDARLARDDVPFTIEHSETEPADALVRAARLADVVVLELDPTDSDLLGGSQSRLVGAVALSGASPVLAVVPEKVAVLDGTVMVAWTDSAEAAAALKASVPMLAGAKAVHLVNVASGRESCDATPALAYLSRHDIHAEFHAVDRAGMTVEEALERQARTLGADWITMGAFGHGRMRELLFGGVTRYLLDVARYPLLLAH